MKPKFFMLGFFMVFLLSFNYNPALAQDLTYAINDIVANGSGKSPTQARTNAIASGQRNAFLILLNRLGINENIGSTLEDEAIADMVASQQIINEKISGNNYSATLNLTFSESFVKYHLGDKISSSKKEVVTQDISGSYLAIPIKLIKDQPTIWEQNNDWKMAWENIFKHNHITYLKLPKGDIDDITIISPSTINDINFTDFEPLLTKYKVEGIMLAYFDFDSIENKVNITLRNIQKFNSTQTKLAFVNVNQLSSEDLVNKVAEKTINYIALINNQKSSSSEQGIVSYSVDVLIDGLDDWLKVKNKLENSNLVSQLRVNSISKNLVKINIAYNSANGNIINFFAKNNLFLQIKDTNSYVLSISPPNPINSINKP